MAPAAGSASAWRAWKRRWRQYKANMATRADIQEVKTLIATKETQATRWQIGVMGGALIAVVAALIRTFLG